MVAVTSRSVSPTPRAAVSPTRAPTPAYSRVEVTAPAATTSIGTVAERCWPVSGLVSPAA